jgi:Leucine-rich repeat (LRR) protein
MSQPPFYSRLRFSLRSLLIAITVLAVVLSVWLGFERAAARKQMLAIQNLAPTVPETYAKPRWIWTVLEPNAPGRVVGLAIRSRRATDEQLAPLANLTDLVWLDVVETQITDVGVEKLTSLQKLERLRIDSTSLSDAGLAHIAKLPRLHQLNLERTKITDAGLLELAKMPSLKEVYVPGKNVTPAGVQRLQKACPKLNVIIGR